MTSTSAAVTAVLLLVPSRAPAPPDSPIPIPLVRPFVSPDGKCVAYGGRRAGPGGPAAPCLVISNLDGSDRREVETRNATFEEIVWVGASRILFSGTKPGVAYEAVTARGEPAEPVVLPPECKVLYKRLSPDGTAVAYMGSLNRPGEEPRYGHFVVTLGTGRVRQVLSEAAMSAPAWSPDSRRLAVGIGGYVKDYSLAVIDVATGQVERVGCNGVGVNWSPDGLSLALTTDAVPAGGWFAGVPVSGRVGVWDLRGKSLRPVTPPGEYTRGETADRTEVVGSVMPVWSPDGRWLAYRRYRGVTAGKRTDYIYETWVVRRDGSEARKVLNHPAGVGWLPDARSFFWTHEGATGFVRVVPESVNR